MSHWYQQHRMRWPEPSKRFALSVILQVLAEILIEWSEHWLHCESVCQAVVLCVYISMYFALCKQLCSRKRRWLTSKAIHGKCFGPVYSLNLEYQAMLRCHIRYLLKSRHSWLSPLARPDLFKQRTPWKDVRCSARPDPYRFSANSSLSEAIASDNVLRNHASSTFARQWMFYIDESKIWIAFPSAQITFATSRVQSAPRIEEMLSWVTSSCKKSCRLVLMGMPVKHSVIRVATCGWFEGQAPSGEDVWVASKRWTSKYLKNNLNLGCMRLNATGWRGISVFLWWFQWSTNLEHIQRETAPANTPSQHACNVLTSTPSHGLTCACGAAF